MSPFKAVSLMSPPTELIATGLNKDETTVMPELEVMTIEPEPAMYALLITWKGGVELYNIPDWIAELPSMAILDPLKLIVPLLASRFAPESI